MLFCAIQRFIVKIYFYFNSQMEQNQKNRQVHNVKRRRMQVI